MIDNLTVLFSSKYEEDDSDDDEEVAKRLEVALASTCYIVSLRTAGGLMSLSVFLPEGLLTQLRSGAERTEGKVRLLHPECCDRLCGQYGLVWSDEKAKANQTHPLFFFLVKLP